MGPYYVLLTATDTVNGSHKYHVSSKCPFDHYLRYSSYLNLSTPDIQCLSLTGLVYYVDIFNKVSVLCLVHHNVKSKRSKIGELCMNNLGVPDKTFNYEESRETH